MTAAPSCTTNTSVDGHAYRGSTQLRRRESHAFVAGGPIAVSYADFRTVGWLDGGPPAAAIPGVAGVPRAVGRAARIGGRARPTPAPAPPPDGWPPRHGHDHPRRQEALRQGHVLARRISVAASQRSDTQSALPSQPETAAGDRHAICQSFTIATTRGGRGDIRFPWSVYVRALTGSGFQVPGSSSRFWVPGSRFRSKRFGWITAEPGTKNLEPEPGTWNQEPGTTEVHLVSTVTIPSTRRTSRTPGNPAGISFRKIVNVVESLCRAPMNL